MTKLLPVESYYFTSFKEKDCEIHNVFFYRKYHATRAHSLSKRIPTQNYMCDSYNRAQFWRISELTITDYFKAHRECIKKGHPQCLIDMLKILTSTNKSKKL